MARTHYITPTAERLSVRVEQGYMLSGYTQLTGGTERTSTNGKMAFGDGEPYDNGSNVEGLGENGTIYM